MWRLRQRSCSRWRACSDVRPRSWSLSRCSGRTRISSAHAATNRPGFRKFLDSWSSGNRGSGGRHLPRRSRSSRRLQRRSAVLLSQGAWIFEFLLPAAHSAVAGSARRMALRDGAGVLAGGGHRELSHGGVCRRRTRRRRSAADRGAALAGRHVGGHGRPGELVHRGAVRRWPCGLAQAAGSRRRAVRRADPSSRSSRYCCPPHWC